MHITNEEFERLLWTSKMSVTSESQRKRIINHIGLIVDWTSEIRDIDTEGVEPLINVMWDVDEHAEFNPTVESFANFVKVMENLKIKRHDEANYFYAPTRVVEF